MSLWKTSTYFLWGIVKSIIFNNIIIGHKNEKRKKPLQESKSHKKNIKPIFSQSEQSLFMGIVFESQTEKTSNFGFICVLCPLPSKEIIIQIIVRGHIMSSHYNLILFSYYDLRQPQSGI